jgi:hypothetical protein
MRPGYCLALAFLGAVAGCSGSDDKQPACTEANWTTCEPRPSLETRSKSWAEQRTALTHLAEATEDAVAHPMGWSDAFTGVRVPFPIDTYEEGLQYARVLDRAERQLPLRDARVLLEASVSQYVNVATQAANAGSDARLAADALTAKTSAETAWMQVNRVDLFRDAFGQLEPRSALFTYAFIATQTQFLLDRPAARHARAAEAATFLDERIREWEQMQRERLAGRSQAELLEAFDAFGTPELRRLIQAWTGIENLAVPSTT